MERHLSCFTPYRVRVYLCYLILLDMERERVVTVKLVRATTDEDEAFWRKMVLPADAPSHEGRPWKGCGRWFRADNVIPIERWKRVELDQKDDAAA